MLIAQINIMNAFPSTLSEAQIVHRFQHVPAELRQWFLPLVELAQDSETLLKGYATTQTGWNKREDLIPYYHVLGRASHFEELRVLIIGGWTGTDHAAILTLLRLIAAMEQRFQLVQGIEATIYPALNWEAARAGVALTGNQALDINFPWQNSSLPHILTLQREVWRYDYDAVIHLKQRTDLEQIQFTLWGEPENPALALAEAQVQRLRHQDHTYPLSVNQAEAVPRRRVTPVPDRLHQPIEIGIGLPENSLPLNVAEEAMGVLLALIHGLREARENGQLP